MRPAVILVVLSACGRIGFDPHSSAGVEAAPDAATTDGAVGLIARDATADVRVTTTGFVYSRVTMRFVATVTIANTSTDALPAPITLVFDALSANATVYQPDGVTLAALPAGSPYLDAPDAISPSGQDQLVMEVDNPSDGFINFVPRVLVGAGAR